MKQLISINQFVKYSVLFFPVFAPYGKELGDATISTGDDVAVKFTLQKPFPFFAKKYPVIYVR